MNFRRGFFRLWLIVSALWVLLIVALAPSLTSRPLWQEIADGWRAEREWAADPASTPEFDFLAIPVEVDERIKRGDEAEAAALNLGKFAMFPPLMLLALGALTAWAFSGFRRG